MIAVIELKGKQYRVEPEQIIRTLRIDGAAGDKLEAERVLATIDGANITVGKPALDGVKVELEIVRQAKSPKIKVFTYSPKKRTARKMGYRDEISYLRVKKIEG